MHPIHTVYKTLTEGLFLIGFPPLWLYTRLTGKYQEGLRERLGFVPLERTAELNGSPRIWIHAASLGEIKVAAALEKALLKLFPHHSLILSTYTAQGYRSARELLPKIPVIYAPLDLSFAVDRALQRIRPDIMIFLETELWPNWLLTAHRLGIKIALLNGRISARSIDNYLKFKFLFRQILAPIKVFSMIGPEDAVRIQKMGARPSRVVVNGNAKYDLLSAQTSPQLELEMRRVLNVGSQKVIVAGSTRGGEESTLLAVYAKVLQEFPDTLLFIAPRHIERTSEIERLLNNRGMTYQLRTELDGVTVKRTAPVVIINTFGELFKLYSVATIAFCGASLAPLGGQNPLEAAAWGKPVFYGPFMEDFTDAKHLLESCQAGIPVANAKDFSEKVLNFFHHPAEGVARATQARERIRLNQGSAQNHVKAIARLWG
ncbi:MAG: 3-deoxy-D-manno-octulosonic acid transferase [Desulfobacteraceae bacterium]|nr:MAG: 3-deoxy-D-manno-octulosonic acid transferase [Desulfobacteraceae bacterium]